MIKVSAVWAPPVVSEEVSVLWPFPHFCHFPGILAFPSGEVSPFPLLYPHRVVVSLCTRLCVQEAILVLKEDSNFS